MNVRIQDIATDYADSHTEVCLKIMHIIANCLQMLIIATHFICFILLLKRISQLLPTIDLKKSQVYLYVKFRVRIAMLSS